MTDSIWYSYECSFPLGICKNVYPKQKSVKKKSVTPRACANNYSNGVLVTTATAQNLGACRGKP